MASFTISSSTSSISGSDIQFMSFPGGERHVRLPDLRVEDASAWQIEANIYTPQDIMDLLLLTDALRRMLPARAALALVLPYVPYARQDRVALVGEPLSIKVFCSLINALEFDSVTVWDPHSEVTPALLNRVRVKPASNFVVQMIQDNPELLSRCVLVAPDAGARKRVEAVSQALGGRQVVYGGKKRDPLTGALSGFYVDGDVPTDVPLLVVDDICDGGGTFIALAKVLREKTAQPLYLYVTHGLFTRGLAPLLEAGYAQVFAANCRDAEIAPAVALTACLTPSLRSY